MAKRITDIQKKELVEKFSKGEDLESLSEKFKFSRLTISRHLKKLIGEIKYQQILNKDKFGKNLTVIQQNFFLQNKQEITV